MAKPLSDLAPVDPTDPGTWPESLSGPARALLGYWISRCGADGRYPPLSAVSPGEIRDVLPQLFIVDCLGGEPNDYRFRLVGTEIVAVEGESTGRLLSELIPDRERYAAVWAHYDGCRAGQIRVRHQNLDWKGKTYLNYEVLLLPLIGEDGSVTHLIGTAVAIPAPS